MRPYILLLLKSSILILNCSSKDAERSQVYLLHDIWALNSINGEKVIIDETFKSLPVLEIYVEEERVHGNTGCNTLDGKLDINENRIKFLNLVTTEIACPGNFEQQFLSTLQKVNNYKIEKMRLFLYEDDQELMSFKKID